MTNIEKGMIVAMAVCIIAFIVGVASCNHAIEQAGGMKNIIIETGKEIKDIKKKIDD